MGVVRNRSYFKINMKIYEKNTTLKTTVAFELNFTRENFAFCMKGCTDCFWLAIDLDTLCIHPHTFHNVHPINSICTAAPLKET